MRLTASAPSAAVTAAQSTSAVPAARVHTGLSSAVSTGGGSLTWPSSQHRALRLTSSTRCTQSPSTPACENTVSPTTAITPWRASWRA
jgi:hypothetical protein